MEETNFIKMTCLILRRHPERAAARSDAAQTRDLFSASSAIGGLNQSKRIIGT